MRKADNLTTLMCGLSLNLGYSPYWNPQGRSKPVGSCFTFYRTTNFPLASCCNFACAFRFCTLMCVMQDLATVSL